MLIVVLRKILFFLFLTLILILRSSYGESISSVIKKINNLESIPPHCGIRVSIFYKNNNKYISKAEIKFKNFSRFKMTTIQPETQKGNIVGADGENLIMYMPKYRMKSETPLSLFTKIDKERPRGGGAGFILDFDLDKLFKNYQVKLQEDKENYILSIISLRKPAHQRNIWINKRKNLIVKDERYFDNKLYFKFYYEKLEFKQPEESELEIKIPAFVFTLPSSKEEQTVSYFSMEEARKNLKGIPFLKKIPERFEFILCRIKKEMGKETISVRYSDGVINILLQKREKRILRDGILKLLRSDEILKEFRNYTIPNFYEYETEEEVITISGEFPENLLKDFLGNISK